jgi:hypothetical protein
MVWADLINEDIITTMCYCLADNKVLFSGSIWCDNATTLRLGIMGLCRDIPTSLYNCLSYVIATYTFHATVSKLEVSNHHHRLPSVHTEYSSICVSIIWTKSHAARKRAMLLACQFPNAIYWTVHTQFNLRGPTVMLYIPRKRLWPTLRIKQLECVAGKY